MSERAKKAAAVLYERGWSVGESEDGTTPETDAEAFDDDNPRRPIGHALLFHERYVRRLEALGEMLAAVLQGAKEEFVRVPYGASHEDVAAINDWHKMAAEALREWESRK